MSIINFMKFLKLIQYITITISIIIMNFLLTLIFLNIFKLIIIKLLYKFRKYKKLLRLIFDKLLSYKK